MEVKRHIIVDYPNYIQNLKLLDPNLIQKLTVSLSLTFLIAKLIKFSFQI